MRGKQLQLSPAVVKKKKGGQGKEEEEEKERMVGGRALLYAFHRTNSAVVRRQVQSQECEPSNGKSNDFL